MPPTAKQELDTHTLSILIPAFNEVETIVEVLNRIKRVKLIYGMNKQIVVVDDGSTDSTKQTIEEYQQKNPHHELIYISHAKNRGRGAAIQTGLRHAKGKYLIIQDADLEYDPKEYNELLDPLVNGKADAVFGSRFIGSGLRGVMLFWQSTANKYITLFSNMLANLDLTDVGCSYKAFRTEVLRELPLQETGFGFEPEVVAKVAKKKELKVCELPVSYHSRTKHEGKKSGWKDGFAMLYASIKYNLWR